MELFAHNGVDHASQAEAATHSAGSTVITVLLISAAIVAFMVALVYLLKRFSIIKVSEEEKIKK